jgi:hypothetical protein
MREVVHESCDGSQLGVGLYSGPRGKTHKMGNLREFPKIELMATFHGLRDYAFC